ncbi:MAG: hypothetical protein ACXVAY_11380 [Mucilaginibacter sp.]
MSKRLEDFIKINRNEFDDLEPSADLWNRIEQQLPEGSEKIEITEKKTERKTFSLGFVLRVAASVIVVMGIAFAFYLRNEKSSSINLATINPEYAKQQVHYASLISTKRTELKELSKSDPQLYSEFTSEIAQMDSTYKKLNNDLATSPNRQKVLQAMIRNLQIQIELLNQQLMVIEQYNQMKKQQQNESKNI